MIGDRYDGIGLEFLLRRRREDSAADVVDLLPLLEKSLAASLPRRVKARPTIYTPARIRTARQNAARFDWARQQVEARIAAAEGLIRRPLQELAREMPPPNLERGWNNYCPHCDWWGHGIPGEMDIAARPWQMKCPGCGGTIPGFDARAYVESGRDDRGWFLGR